MFKFSLLKFFIQVLIKRGLRTKASFIVFSFLRLLKKRTRINPLLILYISIVRIRPLLVLKAYKISGKKCNVPSNISFKFSIFLAINWLLESSSISTLKNREKVFFVNIFNNIMDCFFCRGIVWEKRMDFHEKVLDRKPYLNLW